MFSVGLTGGIASGKTTISDMFSTLGVPVIDTDIISRQLLDIDKAGYKFVVERYGKQILMQNDAIDRARLRRLVFNKNKEKMWLESVLHPLIYTKTRESKQLYSNSHYLLVVVPLLFEADFRRLVDRILVVDCSRETQISRLLARDNIDLALANSILDQQWENEARLKLADDIIQNNGDSNLKLQIDALHQKYSLLTI